MTEEEWLEKMTEISEEMGLDLDTEIEGNIMDEFVILMWEKEVEQKNKISLLEDYTAELEDRLSNIESLYLV